MNRFRVGNGYDVHQLVDGKPLVIGGVTIKHDKGALGHSDADVLIHAIIDAILGAAGMADIGSYFPDNDPQYKNADSTELLAKVRELLFVKGFKIGNIDSTIILQEPILKPYIPEMKRKISEILGISENDVSIKAKTNENLGYLGRGEAIAAQAIALIQSA
jgi:2-C-methyl-D-erythritol 2,4-cyclodiphosphate synthase